MKKARPNDAAEEQPQRGGSYSRDPESGQLTLVEATDAAEDRQEPATEFSGFAEVVSTDASANEQEA